MTGYTTVPSDVWREVKDFFACLVTPCKDCCRGNPIKCWHSKCPAYQFRNIARRVASTLEHGTLRIQRHTLIENEILDILNRFNGPVYPSQLVLSTTNSKANKFTAINRLVREGRIVEERINEYTRKISLPTTKGK